MRQTAVVDVLEEWADVAFQPLPLEQVAVIEYSDRFRRIFGLLNAATKLTERGMRGIRLAKACIQLNKAHVTAWTYRYECALAVGDGVWKEELASIGKVLLRSPKNYQAWNYRRHCVINSGHNYVEEASFVDVALANDAKNYHAWAHRQWALKQSSDTRIDIDEDRRLDTADELIMMDILIGEDVRNNSAWNHRWLLVANNDTQSKQKQLAYAVKLIADKAPRNEAAWNFIAALVRSDSALEISNATTAAKSCVEKDGENLAARKFLASTPYKRNSNSENNAQEALEQCTQLAQIDKVRSNYWTYRAEQLRAMMTKQAEEG